MEFEVYCNAKIDGSCTLQMGEIPVCYDYPLVPFNDEATITISLDWDDIKGVDLEEYNKIEDKRKYAKDKKAKVLRVYLYTRDIEWNYRYEIYDCSAIKKIELTPIE